MKLLLSYLKRYQGLVLLSFVLAAINQGFSLLDPVFFGKMIDQAKEIWDKNGTLVNGVYENMQMGRWEYMQIVGKFTLILISVAMISRIAKAFQDYTVNSVVQNLVLMYIPMD